MNLIKKKLIIFILGTTALIWFIIRVIPKPSRASYPCQRVAFPIASAFVLWITGSLFSHNIFKKAKIAFNTGNISKAFVFSLLALTVFVLSIFALQMKNSVFSAINFMTLSQEGKMLYAKEVYGNAESITTPRATVAIVRSDKVKATDITFDEIDKMIRQAVQLAGSFDNLIHEGDVVVIKPNVITCRAQGASYSDSFPVEANGIATDYRIIQVVVNMVREKNKTGKIVMLEGSGSGSTRKNMDALGYTNITGLDSIIYLDENIAQWYDTGSSTLVKVSLPAGKNLYSTKNEYYLNKVYYEADVLISLPCLKSHNLTGITGGIKNVGIGATPVEMYGNGIDAGEDGLSGRWYHIDHGDFSTQSITLDKWIHDFYSCKPVNYVIMDGLQGIEYGPFPGSSSYHLLNDVQKNLRVILAGKDPLAVDAIEALIAGFDPYLIGHLVYLGKDSIGCINSAFIRVKGTQVHEIKTDFKEDMPGQKNKYTDFSAPQDVTLTSWIINNNNLTISLVPNEDISKIEIAYDNIILDPVVIDDFSNFTIPFTIANGDAEKIKVLVYDKYLNCTTLTLDESTNIHHPEIKPFNIYPNPAISIINFDLPDNKATEWIISIYTSEGKLVLYNKLTGLEKQQLDISKFKPGIYFVKLHSGDVAYQMKLVKN